MISNSITVPGGDVVVPPVRVTLSVACLFLFCSVMPRGSTESGSTDSEKYSVSTLVESMMSKETRTGLVSSGV